MMRESCEDREEIDRLVPECEECSGVPGGAGGQC